MALPNIKELRELLKLLRSQGVLQYQSTDLNLVLSENFQITNRKSQSTIEEPEELSPEEEAERILFYSTPQIPEAPEQ